MIAFAGMAALNLPDKTAFATAGIILLMAILASAAIWGLGAGLIASGFAALTYDFFFFPPIYSFEIDDWRNGLSVSIFGLAGATVSFLAERLRERARAARHRAILAKRLYFMGQHLWGADNVTAIARTTVASLGVAMGAKTILLIPVGETFKIAAAHPREALDSADFAAASPFQNEFRRIGDPIKSEGPTCTLVPMDATFKKNAIVVVGETTRRFRRLPDRARILDLFASQAATAFERAALSDEIQQARVAAETERLRSALLTSISHDLKTPLSIILGSASSLRELNASLSERSAQDLLGAILEEGERLDQFIANLLDMSRVESEAVRPRRQFVEVGDVIGSALQRAARLISRHRVVVEVPDGLPLLELDPVLMEKVLFNLIDNAAKYTPNGSLVTLSAFEEGGFIVLRVTDEGQGIPGAELYRLFERFYRVNTGGWKPAGTGLGLAICRGFLQSMGGSISATNRTDRDGAVFTIKLPTGLSGRHSDVPKVTRDAPSGVTR